jgi:hypothetical protein
MYLEISGRGTGKTTRLVDHASDELIQHINDPNYKMGIVSPSIANTRRINKLIEDEFELKLMSMGWDRRIPPLTNKIKMFHTMSQQRGVDSGYINQWYVDEFSFMRETELRRNVNAYYCTSPSGMNRFTVDLLNYCRSNHIDVVSYDISLAMRETPLFQDEVRNFDNWCIDNELWMERHPFEPVEFVKKTGIKRHRFNE